MAKIVELNVGGVCYSTKTTTLKTENESFLSKLSESVETGDDPDGVFPKDSTGRVFLDRDGHLFRYVLDYLRQGELILPDKFKQRKGLRKEAEFYGLPGLVRALDRRAPGSICVGYRGTFAFGRDGLADVKFRKLSRILVSGKVHLCREVFQDTLNESRDPDRGTDDRYTARYFLKHNMLEQCFDCLVEAGFRLEGSAGSGTNSLGIEVKPGQDTEENKWQHYNEFVFLRS